MPKLSKADQTAKVSQNEARRRKEEALARLRELEVAEKEGRVIPREAAASAMVKAMATVRAAVLRIPSTATRRIMAATDETEAREILTHECEAALRGASDELRDYISQ